MRILMAAVVMCVGLVSVWAGGGKFNSPSPNSGSTKSKTASNPVSSGSNLKAGKGDNQKAVPVEGKDFEFELKIGLGLFSSRPIPVKMKWIPAGTFQMGSTAATDPDHRDETQHTVTLTRGYWLMETEVTQEMYYTVMGQGRGTARFEDLKNPMEMVSWYDASDFCRDIGKNSQLTTHFDLSGFEFRLPTEAEWEYACRAGTTTAVYVNYGDRNKELDAIAWYDWNSGNATRNVRQKLPNAWGLYDMIGNVNEWCWDWYDAYPTGSVTDPKGPSTIPPDHFRVTRGGSWLNDPKYARSAVRAGLVPVGRYNTQGIRAARSRVR